MRSFSFTGSLRLLQSLSGLWCRFLSPLERVDPPTVWPIGLDLKLSMRALTVPLGSSELGYLGNVDDPWSVPV